MKALKIIGIIVVALIAIVLVLGIIAPKDIAVERTVEINAPVDIVFDQVSHLKNMDVWSPWSKLDSNMKRSYSGTDGEVGAIAEWEGNEDVGKGKQEITLVEKNKRVETHLTFLEPFESESDAYLNVEENGAVTKVSWGFTGSMPFPMNAMMLFQDMDAALGKDFEDGLANLKVLAEQIAEENKKPAFDIVQTEIPVRTYISVEDTVKWENMTQFFTDNLGKAFQAVATAKKEIIGAPGGIFFTWDVENKQAHMAAGVPVAQGTKIKGFKSIDVGGKALHIAYYGSYQGSEAAHNALGAYVEENGFEMNGPVFEEYITDPAQEPDTSKWLTNIYYFIK